MQTYMAETYYFLRPQGHLEDIEVDVVIGLDGIHIAPLSLMFRTQKMVLELTELRSESQ